MKRHLTAWLVTGALIASLSGCGGGEKAELPQAPMSLAELIASGKSELFSVPFEGFEGDLKHLPVGVFDSGIGGLTVLEEILKIDRFDNKTHAKGADGVPDFENERFVYLGDQANMPYGNYPSENKVDVLREHILKDAAFLLGTRYWPTQNAAAPRTDKPQVKAVVIACNTATAYGYDMIKKTFEDWDIPVYLVGVVDAGALGAIEALTAGSGDGSVAVMATVGTCKSEGYPKAIAKVAKASGIETPEVTQQGSLGLAGAIEGDRSFVTDTANAASVDYKGPSVNNSNAPVNPALKDSYQFEKSGLIGDSNDPDSWRLNSVENYIRYDATSLVDTHSKKAGAKPINTVILGCTHFPFHQESIAASFERLRNLRLADGSMPYKNAVAEKVTFIDPAATTAEQLYLALVKRGTLLEAGENGVISVDEFFISVPNPENSTAQLDDNGGFAYEYKYGRNAGNFSIEYVRRVPMSKANLSASNIESVSSSMPNVWKRLVRFTQESPRTRDIAAQNRL